jgi:hypothetical protein
MQLHGKQYICLTSHYFCINYMVVAFDYTQLKTVPSLVYKGEAAGRKYKCFSNGEKPHHRLWKEEINA